MAGKRPGRGHLAQSPLEIVTIPLAAAAAARVGLLWGTGIVIGSILGSTLPGSPGEGIITMLGSFPDIGAVWEPPIPSPVIWAVTVVVAALAGPLIWKLARVGRLRDQGAQWATTGELRRAGLLVADRPLTHAVPEPAEAADAN